MAYTKPRGTEDVFGAYAQKFDKIENVVSNIARLNGYSEIRTPMFENIEVFSRSAGETSDIVQKEFYNFKDKGDREIALRPEGTASVIRAIVENKLLDTQPLPLKLFYKGPMFRYERPQNGRLRQFNQIGFEIIGTGSPFDDVDVLSLAKQVIDSIGIKDYTLLINNIGNFETRNKWIENLKEYFRPFKSQLSEISQGRIETNPLRIMDDKIDGALDFVKNAPKIKSLLSEQEKQDWELIKKSLRDLNINFVEDETLVRGLDYYTNLVFEFDANGDRNVILAGGRYAKLISEFGGKDYSSIGFALGIERMIIAAETQGIILNDTSKIDMLVVGLTDKTDSKVLELLTSLRQNNISAVSKFDCNKLVKAINYAERINAQNIMIVGEQELANNSITVKNLQSKTQTTYSDFSEFLKSFN